MPLPGDPYASAPTSQRPSGEGGRMQDPVETGRALQPPRGTVLQTGLLGGGVPTAVPQVALVTQDCCPLEAALHGRGGTLVEDLQLQG